jgi:hypothetical protein
VYTKILILAKFDALMTKFLTKICKIHWFFIVLFLFIHLYKTYEYV